MSTEEISKGGNDDEEDKDKDDDEGQFFRALDHRKGDRDCQFYGP